MTFTNPANGHSEEAPLPWLWALLFGPLYFAFKRAYGHALIAFVLAVFTSGISHLIYPFFARHVVTQAYLSRGWNEADQATSTLNIDDIPDDERNLLRFNYRDMQGHTTTRTVDVSELYSANGHLYMQGYCHRAEDDRTFRLDRIIGTPTYAHTGSKLPVKFLMEEAMQNVAQHRDQDAGDMSGQIIKPEMPQEPLIKIEDLTDYEGIFELDLEPDEAHKPTEQELADIDPEEIWLSVTPFEEAITEEALAQTQWNTPGLADLLNEYLDKVIDPEFEQPLSKHIVDDDTTQALLDAGYLIAIPRSTKVDQATVGLMTLSQLKALAPKAGVRASQTKAKLAKDILKHLRPETDVPPLAIPSPKIKTTLQAIANEYLAAVQRMSNKLPPNYRQALKQAVETDADIPNI